MPVPQKPGVQPQVQPKPEEPLPLSVKSLNWLLYCSCKENDSAR